MLFTGSTVVCPRGKPGDNPLVIDLAVILASERRQDEVASVTKFKAPELLAEFNRSWRDLHALVVELQAELTKAQKALDRRKGVLLLEVVPEKLSARKLANNDAHRDAVISLDEQYQAFQETYDQIEAVVEYLKGKLKSFEHAYNSVKKIMGEDGYNMAARGPNTNLSGDAGPSAQPDRPVAASPSGKYAGWGKPKY